MRKLLLGLAALFTFSLVAPIAQAEEAPPPAEGEKKPAKKGKKKKAKKTEDAPKADDAK